MKFGTFSVVIWITRSGHPARAEREQLTIGIDIAWTPIDGFPCLDRPFPKCVAKRFVSFDRLIPVILRFIYITSVDM